MEMVMGLRMGQMAQNKGGIDDVMTAKKNDRQRGVGYILKLRPKSHREHRLLSVALSRVFKSFSMEIP